MKNMQNNILKLAILIAGMFVMASCTEEEELPFEVFESPVLAEFDGQTFASTEDITITATFYDLDKSGILDQAVGIDSVAISNLSVKVFIDETLEVATLTTDTNGKVSFIQPWSSVGGPGNVRLEWVGTYDNRSFRIYHTISSN